MSETMNSEVTEETKRPARLNRPARFQRDMAEVRKLWQYAAELRNIADKIDQMGAVGDGVCSGMTGERVLESAMVLAGFAAAADNLAHARAGR